MHSSLFVGEGAVKDRFNSFHIDKLPEGIESWYEEGLLMIGGKTKIDLMSHKQRRAYTPQATPQCARTIESLPSRLLS